MKFIDMNWEHCRIGTFKVLDPLPETVEKTHRTILLPSSRNTEVVFAFPDKNLLLRAEPTDQTARLLLEEAYRGEKTVVASISEVRDPLIILSSQLFWRKIPFPEESLLCLMVTEQISHDLANLGNINVLAFLREQFLNDDMAFAQTGGRDDANAFSLIGPKFTLAIGPGRLGLQTRSLRPRHRRPTSERLTLFQGAIRFQDATLAGTQTEVISAQLREALKSHSSYLKKWEIYNELDAVLLEQEAREIGTVKYERYAIRQEEAETILVFHLSKDVPFLFRQNEVPIEVLIVSSEQDEQVKEQSMLVGETVASSSFKELHVRVKELWDKPPHTGELRISQRGDKVKIRRRRNALNMIIEGRSQLSTLGLLLETGVARYVENRQYKPLSDRVKRLLHNNPTNTQLEALDVALNTPDIALIQGPPGTGKTSVIRALVARMAELEAKFERQTVGFGESAAVLVTSQQHDAVENAVDGFDVAGLPAYRYGKRRSESNENRDSSVQQWVTERSEACRRHLESFGSTPARQLARDVDRLISQWSQTHDKENQIEIAHDILERSHHYVEPVIAQRGIEAITRAERPLPPAEPLSEMEIGLHQRLKTLVESQRTALDEFKVDGERQAGRLLRFLEDNDLFIQIRIPEELKFATKGEIHSPDFFDRFRLALGNLVIGKTEPLDERSDLDDSEFEELWGEISAALHKRTTTGRDAIAEALQAFVEELEDPEAVRMMMKNYAQVVAATCQQSVSRAYADGKARFEMVVIDEAARAHPLDLLIPLSRGKRIVLVGDHHQLPQMLEPEVIEEYKATNPQADTTLLEKSVFERLFELLKKVEDTGERKRVVTLTDDFRMHPTISKLVSDTFYDKKVKPNCSKSERDHGLKLYDGKPLCWIDVPRSRGIEEGRQSKSRRVEMEVLFKELNKILSGRDDRSVGVITFYDRQAQMLEAERLRLPFEQRRRVRVGTVDSFQGREFDVVLLSTVRSNSERNNIKQRVGFLASRNRLCVAFSRARMLLITVGDADTVAGTESQPAVAEFLALRSACEGEEGYYERY